MNAVVPIPVAARSKAWVCGCLLLGVVGLNPTEDMDVSVVCQVQVSASGCSFVQRNRTKCDREASIMKRPWRTRGCCAMVLVQVFPRLVACSSISNIPTTPHSYASYQNDNLVNPDKH